MIRDMEQAALADSLELKILREFKRDIEEKIKDGRLVATDFDGLH